jgi:hypothetical protein
MRSAHHPKLVGFRAGQQLVDAIAECAKACGCSVSEYLRGLVRDAVGLGRTPPPVTFNHPAQPAVSLADLPVTTRAAMGDGEAFAVLADAHYRLAVEGKNPAITALAEARVYARLAAASRNSREDWLSWMLVCEYYATALRQAGFPEQADIAQAEAVTIAEHMADNGDEEVAQNPRTAGGRNAWPAGSHLWLWRRHMERGRLSGDASPPGGSYAARSRQNANRGPAASAERSAWRDLWRRFASWAGRYAAVSAGTPRPARRTRAADDGR